MKKKSKVEVLTFAFFCSCFFFLYSVQEIREIETQIEKVNGVSCNAFLNVPIEQLKSTSKQFRTGSIYVSINTQDPLYDFKIHHPRPHEINYT